MWDDASAWPIFMCSLSGMAYNVQTCVGVSVLSGSLHKAEQCTATCAQHLQKAVDFLRVVK